MYHSYSIDRICHTTDFNGDDAFEFKIRLGGTDLVKINQLLEDLLEYGLDKDSINV